MDDEGNICLIASDNQVYIVDVTGRIVWQYASGAFIGLPIGFGDGHFYLVEMLDEKDENTIIAIDVEGIASEWAVSATGITGVRGYQYGLVLSEAYNEADSAPYSLAAYPGPVFDSVSSDTADEREMNCSPATAEIEYVYASSALPDQGEYKYGPLQIFDGDEITAWNDGAVGGGVGEVIEILFANPVEIDAIRLSAGFFDARYFMANARVRQIRVKLFDDTGRTVLNRSVEIPDEMQFAELGFNDLTVSGA